MRIDGYNIYMLQGSRFIDVILDAPGSEEIERRCHFSDGETLKYEYSISQL